MVRLHFENTDEFETLFKNKSLSVTRTIVSGIEEAEMKRKKTALLFEITFDVQELSWEISLPRSQWQQALESCLDHLHKVGTADEQIDCWKLLEAIKK